MLDYFVDKKKATVKELQVLAGYLNFIGKAVFPGRAFTRRIYAKFAISKGGSKRLKHFHHVSLDQEFRFDIQVWRTFLTDLKVSVCRPVVDLKVVMEANELRFYTDASANENLGCGSFFDGNWFFLKWEPGFIKTHEPTIEYFELFALCVGVLTWGHMLKDTLIVVFCDNLGVCSMVNSMSSTCKHCMYLLRLLVLSGLKDNRRVFARHIFGFRNSLADSLSRLRFDKFWKLAPDNTNATPTKVTSLLWPLSNLWEKHGGL